MSAFDAMRPVLDELRAMGVHVTVHALDGGLGFVMHGTGDWSPEFSRKVAEVLTRHGMREYAEGSWVSADATADQIRRMEESQRSDHEYKHTHDTIAEHPDWTDEQVAEACGVAPDYVADLRYERDR